MPNYQNGKIYMIESLEGKCRYYGSTTQKHLCVRMAGHRCDYKNKKKKITSSSKVLCFDDAKIILVENYPCNSREELLRKEGEYIRNNDCVNRNIAGRNSKMWNDEHKEHNKLKSKKYYHENKKECIRKQKIYNEKNKVEKKKYKQTGS